jgi:hypothetical protein
MKARLKPLLLAAALAATAATTFAQPGPAGGAGMGPGAGQPEPERAARMQERRQEHMARRAADLKAKLKLTPEQEKAWKDYAAAMKPPARAPQPNRAEIDKLSTPERLDKMRELRKLHEAEFDKRDAATRTFYGTLSAEQKKIFDDNTGRHFREGRQWGQR